MSAYETSPHSRHLVDLEDGLTSRWADLTRLDSDADDSAFAVITNT